MLLSSTLNGVAAIDDINKDRSITKVKQDIIYYCKGFDNVFGLVDNRSFLSLYDIRDTSILIGKLSCLTNIKNVGDSLYVNNIAKSDHKLLISTNQETFTYDLRQLSNPLISDSNSAKSKRRSLTYTEPSFLEDPTLNTRINSTKTYFISQSKAIIIDFIQSTLDLYDLETCTILKSLYFAKRVYDMSFSVKHNLIAVMLDNDVGEKELAFFDDKLTLKAVHVLKNVPYQNIGFVSTEGKLLLHSVNNYEVLELVDIFEDERIINNEFN